MKNEIIPYHLIHKLLPGVTNRQEVLRRLGKPEVISFGEDYKVTYRYRTEGIEVVLRIGEQSELSIVKAVVLVYPFQDSCVKCLDIGMSFTDACSICDSHYEFELDTETSRIYSLGDPKLNIQIWKAQEILEKIEFFQ